MKRLWPHRDRAMFKTKSFSYLPSRRYLLESGAEPMGHDVAVKARWMAARGRDGRYNNTWQRVQGVQYFAKRLFSPYYKMYPLTRVLDLGM